MARVFTTSRRLGGEALALTLGLVALALLIKTLPWLPPDRQADWSARGADWQLRGVVWPARSGVNRVELTALDGGGAPLTGAQIDVLFLPVGGGALITQQTLTPAAEAGHYQAEGLALSRPGPWQMLVTVRQADQITGRVALDWVIGPDGALRPASEPMPWAAGWLGWWNRSGAWALAGLALIVCWAWGWWAWRRLRPAIRAWPAWWLAPLAWLAALALYLYALLNA